MESISARLGESMDSFALAQDSDEENARNRTPSPNTSASNLADRSLSSIDESNTGSHPSAHPHPLEPEVIVSSPAAILPQEVMVISNNDDD